MLTSLWRDENLFLISTVIFFFPSSSLHFLLLSISSYSVSVYFLRKEVFGFSFRTKQPGRTLQYEDQRVHKGATLRETADQISYHRLSLGRIPPRLVAHSFIFDRHLNPGQGFSRYLRENLNLTRTRIGISCARQQLDCHLIYYSNVAIFNIR